MLNIMIRNIDEDAYDILEAAAESAQRPLATFCRLELEKLAERIQKQSDRRLEKANAALRNSFKVTK